MNVSCSFPPPPSRPPLWDTALTLAAGALVALAALSGLAAAALGSPF